MQKNLKNVTMSAVSIVKNYLSDALMESSSYTNPAWQLWHQNCVINAEIEVQDSK